MPIIDVNEELMLDKKDVQEWDMLQAVIADAYKRLACIILRNKYGISIKVMKSGKVKIDGELYDDDEFEDWLAQMEEQENNKEYDEFGNEIKHYDA